MNDEREKRINETALRVAEACRAWVEDTGECHMCTVGNEGKHDDECPVGEYMLARNAPPKGPW